MLRQKSSEIRAVIVRWTHVKTKNVPTTSTQFLLVEHDAGLEPKGIVNKYFVGENASACFELIKEGDHQKERCYHCRCEQCGKLIHLHCEELDDINQHLESEHGFLVNPFRTVFYGVCAECQKGDE